MVIVPLPHRLCLLLCHCNLLTLFLLENKRETPEGRGTDDHVDVILKVSLRNRQREGGERHGE